MQATVTWQKDMLFDCETDSGKTLQLDGNGEQLTPMETVLLSVGACSSVDVVEIMKKSRLPLRSCRCELKATRAESAPKVFTDIHAEYVVSGEKISDKHLARAVQLSCEKYCSVMLMLAGNVNITTSYRVEEL
ncbi:MULTISPECIES: OsmC family protein [Alteromonadaceae]|uniref:OsmC family protein n=1 Tax=Alteromonadaceae TaxID=72275 RepID=UPI001C0987CD|nr:MULTISPECIES: OsmC family protein [Aliiglaciecola]MBU2877227.1 OsmC family protein [Aliiglaciecola lipolytica]MDO6712162.1 OsmC family protein [Aliiglaciecola sp. 2_MG-2023]MDO6753242.1 OsmC family protein [Aliiglaciecola sp. 1_MG-2023]